MSDLKTEAARTALQFVKPGQTIGLGAGSTVAYFVALAAREKALAASLTFTSSSFKTTGNLMAAGLRTLPPAFLDHLDIYFDGCDQFDPELNALKSGGGIHTTEKILAAMADEFILMGDDTKFSQTLDGTYPLVLEILPQALPSVLRKLAADYPKAKVALRMSTQKDGALISDNGNLLADMYFDAALDPALLNTAVKMIPGVADHSLFYRMATKAIMAGEAGVKIVAPNYKLKLPR